MPKIILLLVVIYVTSAGCRGRHFIALKAFLRGAFWWPDIYAGARQKTLCCRGKEVQMRCQK